MKVEKFLQSLSGFLLVVVAMIAPLSLHAADLMSVYRDAAEYDAPYRAARAAHRAAMEKLPQGRAGLLPTVNLSGVGRKQYVERSSAPQVTIDNASLTITGVQPIFRMDNFLFYQQSKILVVQADSQFVIAAQDLILRTSQAYFDVLVAQTSVEVAGLQKKAIAEQLAQAKRSFEVGSSTIVDTNEAQARFDLVSSQEIAAKSNLEIRKHTLQQITGNFQDTFASADESAMDLFTLRYPTMDEWVAVAEKNNLALKVQEAAYEIAQKDVERAKAGHYPTLDLVALYSEQKGVGATITGRGLDISSQEIGLQLSLPIFQGFAVQSRVREALANQDRVFENLNNVKRTSVLQVRQHYLNVTNGIAQTKALRQAVASSKVQMESTRVGREVGVRTEVDLLNAQQLYYSNRRDLTQARYNLLMSRLQLEAAAGELDEDDIKQANELLK
jgi:outer membrane protein